MPNRPTAQKDIINQLWDVVIGTNGQGLCTKLDSHLINSAKRDVEIERYMGEISGRVLVTEAYTKDIKDRLDQYPSKTTMKIKDFLWRLPTIMATLALLVAVVVGSYMLVTGKPTPSEAVDIIDSVPIGGG